MPHYNLTPEQAAALPPRDTRKRRAAEDREGASQQAHTASVTAPRFRTRVHARYSPVIFAFMLNSETGKKSVGTGRGRR